jgi:hypothetical protein
MKRLNRPTFESGRLVLARELSSRTSRRTCFPCFVEARLGQGREIIAIEVESSSQSVVAYSDPSSRPWNLIPFLRHDN